MEDVDERKYVNVVFLDLKRAFDLVDHAILIYKLKMHHFLFAALKLLQSYIYKCVQPVNIDDVKSDMQPVIAGVPQRICLAHCLA